jgi:hypothetical protein
VARTLLLSGSMKTLVDSWPVCSKVSASSGRPVPGVAPVSKILVCIFLFAILHAQCAAILLRGPMSVYIDTNFSFLGVEFSVFFCSLT